MREKGVGPNAAVIEAIREIGKGSRMASG